MLFFASGSHQLHSFLLLPTQPPRFGCCAAPKNEGVIAEELFVSISCHGSPILCFMLLQMFPMLNEYCASLKKHTQPYSFLHDCGPPLISNLE